MERQNNEYVMAYDSGIEKKSRGGNFNTFLHPLRHNGGRHKANGKHHCPKMHSFCFLMLRANVKDVKCAEN